MPLYIRDDSVDALAEQVKKLTGASSKTDAVRAALQAQLEAAKNKKPLLERIHELQGQADEIGAADPAFDMKNFSDSMWEDA
ncbi:type II toxin-antitoxin system VapB family antitoxin [Phaeobacter inhibens]|uniref:type II toxin-antitoxin system VapB family antitoxin n=1 Tax=Phaeobacter inhibens TaxID=221822 RepID=UPI0021A6A7A1|nr:type II toxin-antitoxin system VapB family antitoxin [Phaeobacter inhibens]UWR62793.1 type II toxin-antitoxin system VapB family antitoxin [Phaeobacter inhibens]